MKTTINLILFLALAWNTANAQVGIGTTNPKDDAALDVESTTKGFLPPRMDNAERDAIASPAQGLVIYNTDTDCVQWYDGSFWFDGCEGGLTPGPLSDCPTIPPFLPADETIVKDIVSPSGQTWMDRNLGAYNEARSSTDCWAYGNLYQWGRASDGHEFRGSPTHDADADGFASTPVPNTGVNDWDGEFIFTTQTLDFSTPADWLDPQDNSLWQGVNGTNNPCPAGYKVPSQAEMQLEVDELTTSTAADDAYANLKLPVNGTRSRNDGSIINPGAAGYYWTSEVTTNNIQSWYLAFINGAIFFGSSDPTVRAAGHAVRCIRD